jgi:hypothetical protein
MYIGSTTRNLYILQTRCSRKPCTLNKTTTPQYEGQSTCSPLFDNQPLAITRDKNKPGV